MQNHFSHSIENAWLRESVKIRALQTRSSLFSMFLIALIMLFALEQYIPVHIVLFWVSGILLTVGWRYLISARIMKNFERRGNGEIKAADRNLRICSVMTQLGVGLGVALCWGEIPTDAAYIITAAQLLHGMGCMINLSYDYKSFKYSLPMLMIPPFIFWVVKEGQGSIISASIVLLSFMMLNLVKRSEASLKDTFKMRFENVRLLQQVEAERAKTEEALTVAQKANQTRSFFMAAASHDLRQPLFALSILTDTLGLQPLPDSAKLIFEKQKSSIAALRSLFDNLLDLSKFDSGQIDPKIESYSLESILSPIDEEFAVICANRGISWTLKYPSVAVQTDRDLLQRVVRNLLTNATNFTDEGGVSLNIIFRDDKAYFEVADTGCGIAEADQKRVFDDFVQLNNSNRLRTKGVGLGLAITKHINQLLGLKLNMSSKVNQGTKFSFECPASLLIKPVKEEKQPQISTEMVSGLSVWIFEDEPLVRDALRHQFQAWNCPAEMFESRQDFMEKKGRFENLPDLVILDDMLSHDESGLDLAEELMPLIGAKRILLMTGNSDPERLQTLDSSPFIYARKPISLDWLIYWMMTAGRSARIAQPEPSDQD
ncbi:hybrid sensor histidine kinase/response regulator [Hahella sp. CCB-MM4]|uniref:ATP-binding response regulator n=1 Tax=Hahella sp. (strain CCB-MM4) TaxID=1926491 RepID=UPI00113FEB27|nr:ATP-binding protein [Hahella sp. CCB-MM4]